MGKIILFIVIGLIIAFFTVYLLSENDECKYCDGCGCAEHQEMWEYPDEFRFCYADKERLFPGDTIRLAISATDSQVAIYLIRHLPDPKRFKIEPHFYTEIQEDNPHAHINGCGWEYNYTYAIPDTMIPGLYSFNVYADHKWGVSPFALKRKGQYRVNDAIGYILATNTWQAYNSYRDSSFYRGGPQDYVNRERPLISGQRWYMLDGTDTSTWWNIAYCHTFTGDYGLAQWLDYQGYEIDYYTDLDLHFNPEFLDRYECIMIGPHSEYWTSDMIRAMDDYVNNGGRLIILGGNTMYYRVTYDHDNYKLMECHQNGGIHEQDNSRGGVWAFLDNYHVIENVMLSSYDKRGYGTSSPFEVLEPEHWIFRGTGLQEGDLFGWNSVTHLMASGWETDVIKKQTPENTVYLARGLNPGVECYAIPDSVIYGIVDTLDWDGSGGASMLYRDYPNNGFVFNVGSVSWYHSLWADEDVQRITKNVVDRALYMIHIDRETESESHAVPETFEFSAYPNPFNSKIVFEGQSIREIEIFDISGKKLRKFQSNGYAIWQPSSDIPSGIYMAKVTNKSGFTKKTKLIYSR